MPKQNRSKEIYARGPVRQMQEGGVDQPVSAPDYTHDNRSPYKTMYNIYGGRKQMDDPHLQPRFYGGWNELGQANPENLSYELSKEFRRSYDSQTFNKPPRNYRRSDERIYERVCERLTASPDVDASEMTVEVKEGVVTLGGTVTHRRMKYLAEEIAASEAGVREVSNRVRVGVIPSLEGRADVNLNDRA